LWFRLAGTAAHDVEREAQQAPALDEVRDGALVDEIGNVSAST
jgi:hypothetical protein